MRNINNPKIYIAGHTGMVGSSIIRVLRSKGFTNLIYRKHSDLDLIDQAAVKDFFLKENLIKFTFQLQKLEAFRLIMFILLIFYIKT